MAKKLILGLALALPFGAAGYFGEQFVARPEPEEKMAKEPMAAKVESDMLFKMPLGKFTIRVAKETRVLHLLFDIDLYLLGATEFERLNGAMGRALLRDGTISVISEMAETALWITEEELENLEKRFLAEQIVRKLYLTFPMVRTARINQFTAGVSVRQFSAPETVTQ